MSVHKKYLASSYPISICSEWIREKISGSNVEKGVTPNEDVLEESLLMEQLHDMIATSPMTSMHIKNLSEKHRAVRKRKDQYFGSLLADITNYLKKGQTK